MYLPKIREIKEALSSFFTAPYTTKFPKEPFTAADEYRGRPRYNEEYCVGCGTCAQVCPATAIEVIDSKLHKIRTLKIDYGSCINCGQCEEHCITTKGIKMTNEHSLAVMDRNAPEVFETVDKNLVLCEVCGEIVAPQAHLSWIKNRLGAKAYAHPNFLLEKQKSFAVLEKSEPKEVLRREDQIKEVCPKCRHKIVVKDEFYGIS